MLAFTIPDTKSFMNLLLKQDTFDQFLFRQGEIVTFASFIMEGKRHMDFYAEEEQNTLSRYVRWRKCARSYFRPYGETVCRRRSSWFFPFPKKKRNICRIRQRLF